MYPHYTYICKVRCLDCERTWSRDSSSLADRVNYVRKQLACLLACVFLRLLRYEILRGMGLMWSEPILVDWEEEDERDREENEWRRWGYMPVDEEEENISVDPEFGLKDTDPLL